MAIVKLEKPQWESYLGMMSQSLLGKQAEIEVNSLAIGNQIEAEWLPLLGVAYDTKNDVLEIALEGLDHLIHKPTELYIDEHFNRLISILVLDAEGIKQIINMRDPIMLPHS